MDHTIRLRSSHVGVSRCLRLIRHSGKKCVQSLLNDSAEQFVMLHNSDGKVLKSLGCSETST